MTRDIAAARMKHARVQLLTLLNRMYPTPLLVRTLYRVMVSMDEAYEPDLLRKDAHYLKQKGYVEFVDDRLGGADVFMDKCLSLTASGKEIADRTQTDPALEI
ncbi:MAG: hypothetical protein PHQ53_13090 [Candidatus Krumholzibacteria bacterium]|nr:hypothetical protein [Candidatus Krumholzibacteria bacterium]